MCVVGANLDDVVALTKLFTLFVEDDSVFVEGFSLPNDVTALLRV